MENNIKVTIAIAVYNIEKYLKRCMDSIFNQDFLEEYEILVIDDGSKDSSLEILKSYEGKYKNYKMISQKNTGLPGVRNRAIEEARGEYICFLDGDDYIERDYLKKLYNSIEECKEDLVVCGFNWDYEGKKIPDERFSENISLEEKDILKYLFSNKINTAVWNKIFKLSIIRENKIKFPNIQGAEDYTFILEYLLKSKKISITNEVLYNYYQRDNSLSKDISEEYIINNLYILKLYEEILYKNNVSIDDYILYFVERYVYLLRDYLKCKDKKKKLDVIELKRDIEKKIKTSVVIFNKDLRLKMKIRFLKLKYKGSSKING